RLAVRRALPPAAGDEAAVRVEDGDETRGAADATRVVSDGDGHGVDARRGERGRGRRRSAAAELRDEAGRSQRVEAPGRRGRVALGATLSTRTVARCSETPPSLSRTRRPASREPLSMVAHVVLVGAANVPNPAPSPQSNAYAKPAAVSAVETSCAPEAVSANGEPSATCAGAVTWTVGATFATTTSVALSVVPPSLSTIRPCTA